MLIVSKFGGTSVADANQFRKVKQIVDENNLRKVVVVSAIGKRNSQDNKITDLLYLLAAHIKYGVDARHLWQTIFDRFNGIKKELKLTIDLEAEFKFIKEKLAEHFDENYLVSRGEYLTAKFMSEFLDYDFIDAQDIFFFDYSSSVDMVKTSLEVNKFITPNKNVVVPGFYGSNPNKTIKLFSRGGSDISGSILAAILKADKYENWTDVSGILMADPKLINNPKKIQKINYDELRELSYMGASVIHEETLFPIGELNIPIHILNTNKPDDSGTVICQDIGDDSTLITGISGKKNYSSLTIVKNKQVSKTIVISNVLNVLRKFAVDFEHIPTSIDSFSIIVETKLIEDKLFEIIAEIKKIKDIVDIKVDNDIALVAVIGRNMVTKPGMSGRIFGILGNANINIKMIAQGAKELTIIMGVSNSDFEKTIQKLYMNLVE